MKIHGVRIYPKSVKVVHDVDTLIYVHGSVRNDCSDFFYIFRPLAPLWLGYLFANDFSASPGEDPLPKLRKDFGPSLVAADVDSQLMLLRGEDFAGWGASVHFNEGAFLPVFQESPGFDLIKRLYWDHDFSLTSKTWPGQMRAVLHMWDDIYWQLFSTERSDIELLIRAHAGDSKLEMFFVDFDREFPDPSNQKLQRATVSGETGQV